MKSKDIDYIIYCIALMGMLFICLPFWYMLYYGTTILTLRFNRWGEFWLEFYALHFFLLFTIIFFIIRLREVFKNGSK